MGTEHTEATERALRTLKAASALLLELSNKVAEIRDSQTGAKNLDYVKEILEIFERAKKASQ